MHILCPHCRNPIEVVKLTPREEVACPSCGSSFRLETDSTTGWEQLAGRKLGRFELLGAVGQGAFGTVYRARDPELDRTVAVKVPRAGNLAGPQELDRFLREARSVAQLRHPSIVTVHEVGQADGVPYLVSDFVQGVTLADLMTARRPGFREAAELVAAAADALQYAHERGVVHRDVKPSNVMVGEDGKPCVMDFGLAKRDAGEVTMTVEGQVLGTPAYMSPEQARGDAHKVDGRSDVYSLGVVLYQLLTGELPFRGAKRMLLHQVLHDEPRPPRSLNDHIPRDLETVCLKAMAKEPARRYPTARDLADDLRRWLRGEAIQARPVGRAERALRWVRRRPAAAALLAVSGVAALAVVGLAVGLVYNASLTEAYGREAQARQAEEEQRKRAETYLYYSRIALAEREWSANNVGRAEQLLAECPAFLRGWEWDYLKRMCHADLRTIRAHAQQVNCVIASPDGRRLVTVSTDKTLKVWDAATGKEVRSVPLRETGVSLAFGPGGGRLVVGYGSQDFNQPADTEVLDTTTWEPLARMRGQLSVAYGVAIDRRGRFVAAAGHDGTVWVWDAATGAERHTFRSDESAFSSVAFHPDGRTLAAAVGDVDGFAAGRRGKVIVWDVESGQTLQTLTGHEAAVTCVAFSPDGKELASASWDRTIRTWDVATWKETRTLRGHADRVRQVCYRPDGGLLASCGYNGSVHVWDAAGGRLLRTFRGHTGEVISLAFHAGGHRLASAGLDGTVRIWDPATDPDCRTLSLGVAPGLGVAFSPDGREVVASGPEGTVKTFDVATGRELRSFVGQQERVWSVGFSGDGRQLLAAGEDGTARVWDASGGREVACLRGHLKWVQGAAMSPDGRRVATASGDQTVRVWEAATGKELLSLTGHADRVWGVDFSPDGGRIASAGGDKTVKVWDAKTGQEITTLSGPSDEVTWVRFSPDGRLLAAASLDLTVTVWDTTSDRAPLTLRGHTGALFGVAFSPDGKRLASASVDQMVKVWDLSLGQELMTLRADTGGFHGVAFSPDGRRIAATGHDGTVRVWDATPSTERGTE